jgi:hypothetical protein
MDERKFPAPWRLESIPEGYRVLDANGIVLAYVVAQAGGLTLDEARRIAGVITGSLEKAGWVNRCARGSSVISRK